MGPKTQVRKTSVTDRKKSQRLVLNPPKPQKLIIRGPRLPLGKSQKLKIRLSREPAPIAATEPDQMPTKLRSVPIESSRASSRSTPVSGESGPAPSKSPIAAGEPITTAPLEWSSQPFNSVDPVETTLIGQGADATYDYSDICVVQAVAKLFNGTRTVTRYLDSIDDNRVPIPGFHLGDGVTKLEPVEVYREKAELEMNSILEEALNCTSCNNHHTLTPADMEADIKSDHYRGDEDPAFPISKGEEEDEVAPDEAAARPWEPGYHRLATDDQYKLFMQRANEAVVYSRGHGMSRLEGTDYEFDYAVYCVNYHIHQHRVARRNGLNLCRDDDELEEFHLWRTMVHDADIQLRQADRPEQPTTTAVLTTPKELKRQLKQQVALHRRLASRNERAAHLRDVREHWAAISAERDRHRRDGMVIANFEAAKSVWKRKTRGGRAPRSFPREEPIMALLEEYKR